MAHPEQLLHPAYALGEGIDWSGGQLWQLVVDDAGSAHWTGGDACTNDHAFCGVIGVPDSGDEGFVKGAYPWHAEL